MSNPPDPTLADYCATVDKFIGAIDRVLAEGRAAVARGDEFLRVHGIEPGSGEKALTAASLPAADREVHRRLIELTEDLYHRHLAPPPPAPEPPANRPSAAARALGQRTRI